MIWPISKARAEILKIVLGFCLENLRHNNFLEIIWPLAIVSQNLTVKNSSLKFFKCNIFTILYRIEVGRGKERKKIANWEKPGSWWPKWWMDLEQIELLPFPFFGGGEHQIKTKKFVKLSQVFRKITFWKKVIFLANLPST